MNAVIRVDGGRDIGYGHAVRCTALAEVLVAAGWRVKVAFHRLDDPLQRGFNEAGAELAPLPGKPFDEEERAALLELLRASRTHWLVLDSYRVRREDAAALRQAAGVKLLLVDDVGLEAHAEADAVLNVNPHADSGLYPARREDTVLLFGTRYTLLRTALLARGDAPPRIPDTVRTILLTLGGSDTGELPAKLLKALDRRPPEGLERVVVAPLANRSAESVAKLAGKLHFSLKFPRDFSGMPEWIDSADLVVTACGGTCWEIAHRGRPMIGLVLADNQRPVCRELEAHGALVSMGHADKLDPDEFADTVRALAEDSDLRGRMSVAGRALVDGRGAGRVAAAMLRGSLRLREVREQDAGLLFEWANDPDVRARAFHEEPIPWEGHLAWFEKRLRSDSCLILIAELADGTPVGQVRYEWEPSGDATAGISIAREWRGYGFASTMLEAGSRRLFAHRRVKRAIAWIRPENEASKRAFRRAGYRYEEEDRVNGIPAERYSYSGHA